MQKAFLDKVLQSQLRFKELFRNISEAFDFIQTHSVQIAFLDIDMPEMNGLDVAKKIHELSPATAVIFTTGYPQFALDAFKTHAIGYLLKPIKKEAIIGELENYKKLQQTAFAEDSQKPRFYPKTFGTFDFLLTGSHLKLVVKNQKNFLPI